MTFHLLPQPSSVKIGHGRFQGGRDTSIVLVGGTEENLPAVQALRADLRNCSGTREGCIALETRTDTAAESYSLNVTPGRIEVIGDGRPGLFYGIQTLRQLIRQFGLRIPACTIRDRPAFARRGYYLDISRGRVPRLESLLELADMLASLKINQLQLYVEHVFAFRFDPAIARGTDPVTPAELRALDRHCRERHIELVPSLACFGHMGRILSLPRYRKLAEVEWPARDWEHARWIQRLRGATINPCLPEARRLLRRMLDDFLPAFAGGSFNMCGDETYDLGKGANARRVRRRGAAALYLDHVRFLRREAARHGKALMFWGDVMQHHPDAIRDIPADCTVLDWGYERNTDFGKIARFVDAGLSTYACPSTRGYRVVFNEVEEARANIAGYAREAARAGAAGLLTTDWGDMGHFNMPACSLHGLALGAALSWNPESDERRAFDRAFSHQLFGDATGKAAKLFRLAGTTGIAGWPMMLTDPPDAPPAQSRRAKVLSTLDLAEELVRSFDSLAKTRVARRQTIEELALAGEALALNARHILVADAPSRDRRALGRRMLNFARSYGKTWLRANKPSGLPELRRAFERAAKRLVEGNVHARPVTRGDLP